MVAVEILTFLGGVVVGVGVGWGSLYAFYIWMARKQADQLAELVMPTRDQL